MFFAKQELISGPKFKFLVCSFPKIFLDRFSCVVIGSGVPSLADNFAKGVATSLSPDKSEPCHGSMVGQNDDIGGTTRGFKEATDEFNFYNPRAKILEDSRVYIMAIGALMRRAELFSTVADFVRDHLGRQPMQCLGLLPT